MVNHKYKVSPSARYVSAANFICKDIDIFKKNYISLSDFYNIACTWNFFTLITSILYGFKPGKAKNAVDYGAGTVHRA
jgi:hypothetical protein